MTVAELAQRVDRRSATSRCRIACGEEMLDMEKDLSTLPDPSELYVHLDPPKAFDHRFVRDFCQLAEENEGVEEVAEKLDELWQRHEARLVQEGVTFETVTDLNEELNGLIDSLKEKEVKDYHPGTQDVVRDLVHPSLYPFVEGVSETCVDPDVTEGPKSGKDMWGRPYESSKYQWLPSEVSVSAEGVCKFESYINNLDREKSPASIRRFENSRL